MHKFNIFLAFSLALIIKACTGASHEYKEYNFEIKTKCRVIGDSKDFAIYENNRFPSVLSYSNFFVDIGGNSGNNKYVMEYCECYTDSGNCRIAGGSDKNDGITSGYSRVLLEFEFLGREEWKGKTSDDLFHQYQKVVNLPSNYQHLPDEDDELFFSNIYEFPSTDDPKTSYTGDHAVFDNAEDTIKRNYTFPLYYMVNWEDDDDNNHQTNKSLMKIDENHLMVVGAFRIASVIECVNHFNGKEQVAERFVFTRDHYQLTDLDCNTWGNQTYQMDQLDSVSNSDSIFKMNVAILIFLITLCYVINNV